ncbi:MAG: glycosyltransferase [Cyclobacteriaceae bacterium]
MKVLILTPYPPDEAPSQRFRFELFFKHLDKNQLTLESQSFISPQAWKALYAEKKTGSKFRSVINGFLRRAISLFKISKYDFIFIHRELTPVGPPIFEWIIAKVLNKKIIYDFDDAIWLPDQNRESTVWRWLKWRSKIASICKWSWKVSVGNAYLADFASEYNENVVVIPTVVDTEVHFKEVRNQSDYVKTPSDKKSEVRRLIIGWTGSHSTLQYLDMILPSLQKLEEEIDFTFRVIANKDPQLPLKNYSFLPWNKETEIEDLATIDIGVMPLPDDEWAKGKCGFKLIQYLALEIPAVASPVGVNTDIIQHGQTGFLANSPEEWTASLKTLLQDPSLSAEMGKKGRALTEEKYSAQSQKDAFLGLFET